jgi:hypothetical protein
MAPPMMQLPVVPIRLAQHAGPRRVAVRVSVGKDLPPGAEQGTVWGDAPPPERVALYMTALRAGVPKLASGADPSGAQIITTNKQERGGVTVYTIELSLPPIGAYELAPLAQLMATSSLAGTRDAVIEEVGVPDVRDCTNGEKTRRFTPPFKFKRATARDRIGVATLALEFKSDLSDGDGKDLERWVTAWFNLVEAGAFFIPGAGTPSYGALTEIVDPYPDIWTFHCEHLVADDAACVPLLERLADVHQAHPIKKAKLG